MRPHRTPDLKGRLLAATCGAVVVAMAASGVAYASPAASQGARAAGATATGSSGTTPAGTWRKDLGQLERVAVHAGLIVRTKEGARYDFRGIQIDKGRLTSITSKEITIRRADGPSVAATITVRTKFFGLSLLGLALGDRVVLIQSRGNAIDVYTKALSTLPPTSAPPSSTAASQQVSPPAQWTEGLRALTLDTIHAGLILRTESGFRWYDVDRGHLTSVTSNEITIRRADGPSVAATITVRTRFSGLPLSGLVLGDFVVLVQSHGDATNIFAKAPVSPLSSGT